MAHAPCSYARLLSAIYRPDAPPLPTLHKDERMRLAGEMVEAAAAAARHFDETERPIIGALLASYLTLQHRAEAKPCLVM